MKRLCPSWRPLGLYGILVGAGRSVSSTRVSGCSAGYLALLLGALVLACGNDRARDPSARLRVVIPVAVASSMRAPFESLAAEFEATHPGASVRASYLSSGAAYQQIVAGAPFVLFVSADTSYPAALVQAGHADSDSYRVYARGVLALWVSNRLGAQAAAGAVALPRGVRRIAIANPELAPYGRAARQVLDHMDVSGVSIIQGEDAAQAAQLALASTDAEILPLSLALLPAMSESGNVSLIADSLYQPILHAAIMTARGDSGALALLDFLHSERALQLMAEYGYRAP